MLASALRRQQSLLLNDLYGPVSRRYCSLSHGWVRVHRENSDLHVRYARNGGFWTAGFKNSGFMHSVRPRAATAGNNVAALILEA